MRELEKLHVAGERARLMLVDLKPVLCSMIGSHIQS